MNDTDHSENCDCSFRTVVHPANFDCIITRQKTGGENRELIKQNGMKKCTILLLLMCLCLNAHPQLLVPTVAGSSGQITGNATGTLFPTGDAVRAEIISVGPTILTQEFQQPGLLITPVADTDSTARLSVYPNPASDVIHLSFAGQAGAVLVELFSMDGQLIFSESIIAAGGKDEVNISVQDLACGVYVLKVTFIDQAAPQIFKVQKISG